MPRYIDADKLNEILVSGFIDENDALVESPAECNSMLVWAIQEAKGMPAADVRENVHGEWIKVCDRWGDIVTTVEGYNCSICDNFNADKDNFCPVCGADMRERREDEN